MIIDLSIFDFQDRALIHRAFDAGLFHFGVTLNGDNSRGHVVCCGLTENHISEAIKTKVEISRLGEMFLETIEE